MVRERMRKGGKPVLTREERTLIERLRQITPQTRRLRVEEAVDMLRDMYAEYRRRPVPAFTELVRRASDTIARDFVPKHVDTVPLPSVAAVAASSSSSSSSAAPAESDTSAPSDASSSSGTQAAAAAAAKKKNSEAELLAKQKRLEEAGSVLNNALVEGYKRAVCFAYFISLSFSHPTYHLCVI